MSGRKKLPVAQPARAAPRTTKRDRPQPAECAKHCSCGASFSRKDLLSAKALAPMGMFHVPGEPPTASIFSFSHNRWACRTTFSLPVETFRDQIEEPIPPQCAEGTPACGGHCSSIEDLEACKAECALAPYRRFFLQRLLPRK